MLFPTTIVLALLATAITPAFSAPITDKFTSLAARSEEASLEARDFGDLDLPMDMEKRDVELYEDLYARDDGEMYEDLLARDGDLYEELVARTPEPEPEMEEFERRGKLGFLVKIGKGIAKLFHKGHKASNAVNNNQQQQNQQHHKRQLEEEHEIYKRSKVGNFFKKVWGGIKKVGKAAIKLITKRQEEARPAPLLRRGGALVDNLEARAYELDKRSKVGNFFKKVWRGIKKVGKAAISLVARRSEESTAPLAARSFDDGELEARSFDEPMEEFEARSFEEPMEELNARSFDDEFELEARSFEDEEY